jgi:hypothetical protein
LGFQLFKEKEGIDTSEAQTLRAGRRPEDKVGVKFWSLK